jgi:GNAT superfamily N-acetyltransferase
MDRTTTTTLVVSAFIIVSRRAQQALIQPSSYGMDFVGHALTLECVAALKGGDERHLVETFRAKSGSERRVCLDQLQQSLTPEPDFTAGDFQRLLKQNARGSYEFGSDHGEPPRGHNPDYRETFDRLDDLAVLWDIRVAPSARRGGVGTALFAAAASWARSVGCRQLKIETQNTNVGACRFFARQGCVLVTARWDAYPELPDEVQLLWYKDLANIQ